MLQNTVKMQKVIAYGKFLAVSPIKSLNDG